MITKKDIEKVIWNFDRSSIVDSIWQPVRYYTRWYIRDSVWDSIGNPVLNSIEAPARDFVEQELKERTL